MKIDLRSNYDSFPENFGANKGTVNFYVDNNVYYLEDKIDPKGIALLVEPRAIIPGTYNWIQQKYSHFKYVFTFDSALLRILPNAKLLIYGQITAEFPDDPKDKNISMVCSNKAFCDGHVNRQRVARSLQGLIDTKGKFNGGPFCDDREIYSGYRFNVAMENYSDGHYFTEKICNCLASKVVPIYWGCPHISEYFNMDGIIQVNNSIDIPQVVQSILKDPEGEYNKRLEAIEDNYNRVQKYRSYAKLFLETYGDLLEDLAGSDT